MFEDIVEASNQNVRVSEYVALLGACKRRLVLAKKKVIVTIPVPEERRNSMKAQYTQSIVELLNKRESIRNIAIIAHVDHGKTTLVDSLLSKAGIINQDEAGSKRLMDTGEQEKARGITIKSTGISLVFNKDSKDYLVNLVDSPGHVDFSSEVTAALRITDGAMVVVDCIEGVCVQTEMVTRQALTEQIRPVLHVNKVDRGIMELQLTPEELYQKLDSVIRSVNQVFSKFEDLDLGDVTVDPRKGNVSFGSGKQGWAFTLPQIAARLAKKTGKEESKILKRLWGDHFYDPATKRYTPSSIGTGQVPLERFVCQVLFKPLIKIFHCVRDGDYVTLFDKIIPAIDINLSSKEKELRGNDLLSKILQLWLPAGDALLGLIVDHLPSPAVAQKYRVNKLYTGPLDDEVATAIRNCDPNGPLTVFVSKMVPTSDGSRFFAFGRVFSGTITPKSEVYILNSDYVVGKSTPAKKKVARLVLMMAKFVESVDAVPCGNNVGIGGLESALVKTATITSEPQGYPISPMKFSVSPVVRRALSPHNVADLAIFLKGIKKLINQDPGLELYQSATECVIAGTGELHIECALNDLREFLGDNIGFNVSPPVVKFTETVLGTSSQICLAKSTNKLNRLYVVAEPLSDKLVVDIESKVVSQDNPKEFAQSLQRDYGWDKTETAKLWWFEGTNCLVDMTRAVPYLPSVKDHLISAVQSVCAEGVLCGEPLRGVKFCLMDAMLHADNVHRSSGQIIPAAKRAFLAAQLCAQPALVEPMFLAEIQADQKVVSKIYSLLFKKRGEILEEVAVEGSPLMVVRANMPVLASFGFDAELREATSGYATPTLVFSHWQPLTGSPMTEGTLAAEHTQAVRDRRRLKAPVLADLVDKL